MSLASQHQQQELRPVSLQSQEHCPVGAASETRDAQDIAAAPALCPTCIHIGGIDHCADAAAFASHPVANGTAPPPSPMPPPSTHTSPASTPNILSPAPSGTTSLSPTLAAAPPTGCMSPAALTPTPSGCSTLTGASSSGSGPGAGGRSAHDREQDSRKPVFHVMPRSGWGSDPNGPIFYKGRYHLFYQARPGTCQWHWGVGWDHAVSTDLAHWERLPPAVFPTPGGPDADGCFSGSIAVEPQSGIPVCFYTGARLRTNTEVALPHPPPSQDMGLGHFESQCCAVCDPDDELLTRWRKVPMPLMEQPHTGELQAWRDPWFIEQGDGKGREWTMLIGSGLKERGGIALVYRSSDFTRGWRYCGELCSWPDRTMGVVWECPFLVQLQPLPLCAHVLPTTDLAAVAAAPTAAMAAVLAPAPSVTLPTEAAAPCPAAERNAATARARAVAPPALEPTPAPPATEAASASGGASTPTTPTALLTTAPSPPPSPPPPPPSSPPPPPAQRRHPTSVPLAALTGSCRLSDLLQQTEVLMPVGGGGGGSSDEATDLGGTSDAANGDSRESSPDIDVGGGEGGGRTGEKPQAEEAKETALPVAPSTPLLQPPAASSASPASGASGGTAEGDGFAAAAAAVEPLGRRDSCVRAVDLIDQLLHAVVPPSYAAAEPADLSDAAATAAPTGESVVTSHEADATADAAATATTGGTLHLPEDDVIDISITAAPLPLETPGTHGAPTLTITVRRAASVVVGSILDEDSLAAGGSGGVGAASAARAGGGGDAGGGAPRPETPPASATVQVVPAADVTAGRAFTKDAVSAAAVAGATGTCGDDLVTQALTASVSVPAAATADSAVMHGLHAIVTQVMEAYRARQATAAAVAVAITANGGGAGGAARGGPPGSAGRRRSYSTGVVGHSALPDPDTEVTPLPAPVTMRYHKAQPLLPPSASYSAAVAVAADGCPAWRRQDTHGGAAADVAAKTTVADATLHHGMQGSWGPSDSVGRSGSGGGAAAMDSVATSPAAVLRIAVPGDPTPASDLSQAASAAFAAASGDSRVTVVDTVEDTESFTVQSEPTAPRSAMASPFMPAAASASFPPSLANVSASAPGSAFACAAAAAAQPPAITSCPLCPTPAPSLAPSPSCATNSNTTAAAATAVAGLPTAPPLCQPLHADVDSTSAHAHACSLPEGRRWLFGNAPDACYISGPLVGTRPIYWIGEYDSLTAKYDVEGAAGAAPVDLGNCLYAPSCFKDPQGRHILWGYMKELRRVPPAPSLCDKYSYAGCVSLPRALYLRGDKLFQLPLPELTSLRSDVAAHASRVPLTPGSPWRLAGVRGLHLDLELAVSSGSARRTVLLLRSWRPRGRGAAALVYDWPSRLLYVVFEALHPSRTGMWRGDEPPPTVGQHGVINGGPAADGASPTPTTTATASTEAAAAATQAAAHGRGKPQLQPVPEQEEGEVAHEAAPPGPAFSEGVEDWLWERRQHAGGLLDLPPGSPLRLRVFLDASCLEVFTGTGQVLTTRVYRGHPPPDHHTAHTAHAAYAAHADTHGSCASPGLSTSTSSHGSEFPDPGIELHSVGGDCMLDDLHAYEMDSAWQREEDAPLDGYVRP